jgi:hypothetical protein
MNYTQAEAINRIGTLPLTHEQKGVLINAVLFPKPKPEPKTSPVSWIVLAIIIGALIVRYGL